MSLEIASAERSMQICNACRYCENLCAVFPAMTQLREFDKPTLDYLSNLCHQCGACVESCQYAPPHPFSVNVKQALGDHRTESYARLSPNRSIWHLFNNHGATSSLALGTILSLILIAASVIQSPGRLFADVDGDFYQHLPHGVMAFLAGLCFVIGTGGLLVVARNFMRTVDLQSTDTASQPHEMHFKPAAKDALTLRYLADDLCNAEKGRFRHWQRNFHHAMSGGFMLCFTATVLGTLAHYLLNNPAPYPWYSVTALTGTVGGIAMLAGTSGLIGLKMLVPASGDGATRAMDIGMVLLLWAISITGLMLRWLGDTGAIGLCLLVHLGFVFAFFLTLPFSKMIHIPLRILALMRFHKQKT